MVYYTLQGSLLDLFSAIAANRGRKRNSKVLQ